MKSFYRDLRLTLIVAVVAFGVCWISNSWIFPHSQTQLSEHEWLHKELGLTTEQDQRLIPIEHKFAERKKEIEVRIAAANRELSEIMLKDMAYSDRVKAGVEKIHHIQGELQKLTIEHFYEMQEVLTPEQTKQLHHLAASALLENK